MAALEPRRSLRRLPDLNASADSLVDCVPDVPPWPSKLALEEIDMDASLVSRDPEVMSGALCFTGTRVPVQNLFDFLEEGDSLEVFLEQFPSVTRDMAVAVLEQARAALLPDAHPA